MSVSSVKPIFQRLLVVVFQSQMSPSLRVLISELGSREDCTWHIVAVRWAVFDMLKSEGVPCTHIERYFVEEDHDRDYGQAIDIAHGWFRDASGTDVTLYRGVSIGVVLQRWTIKLFNDFLSNVRTVTRVLQEENPDELWLCVPESTEKWKSSQASRMLREIFPVWAKLESITCREKKLCENPQGAKPGKIKKRFAQRVKTVLYVLIVRRVLFFIKHHLMIRGGRDKTNIMFPSPQTLNYVGSTIVDRLLSDKKRNVFIWRGETIRQRAHLIDVSPPFFCGTERNKEEMDVRIKKQFSEFIETRGIRELKIFFDGLARVYTQQIAPLVRDIVADIDRLQCYFEKKNIHVVFSHADTTIKERTVISVANKHGIPSMVLQHGAAGHYWGFFPLIATRFAAWGEITDSWFTRNGVNRERVCITGAANFDSYVERLTTHESKSKVEWNGLSNYLLYVAVRGEEFATGFKHTEYDNVRILIMLLDAFSTMPERVLVIKLKPGDPQVGVCQSEIEKRGLNNVHLVEHADNKMLLNACGVLLTTYSTMALEALFFSKPVIQLTFVNKKKLMGSLSRQGILCDEDVISLGKCGAARMVETPEALREAIIKMYEDKNMRQSIVANGKMFLKRYCYEPDGKASVRVVKQVEELIESVSCKKEDRGHASLG